MMSTTSREKVNPQTTIFKGRARLEREKSKPAGDVKLIDIYVPTCSVTLRQGDARGESSR